MMRHGRTYGAGIAAGVIALLLAGGAVRGELLVQYDFEGSNLAASASHAAITGADFSYIGDGQTNWEAGVGESGTAFRKTAWPTNDTLDDAFTFAVTIAPGYKVDTESVTFYEQRSAADGPTRWVARYSADGAAWYTFGEGPNASSWSGLDTADDGQPRDLTGTVYFRLYATNAASAAGRWRVDDVTLNGTVRIDDGTRVLRSRDFDGTHLDAWPTATNVHGGVIAGSAERQVSGARSLKLTGSLATTRTNQNIVLANTDISGADNVAFSMDYSAEYVDTDDDLYVEFSYDGGATWTNTVRLVDGFNNLNVPFGETSAETADANPFTTNFGATVSQVAVRVRFEESNNDNANDDYYVDDIRLTGLTEPTANGAQIENYGAPTGVTETQATVRAHVQDGYPYPDVTLYWGTADGGTNSGAWNRETALGTNGWGILAYILGGLEPGTLYYYRFHAANTNGADWASGTTNFSTTAGALSASGLVVLDSLGVGTVQPRCIDRDRNGLSDTWEEETFGSIGQDPDTDSDNDGVTNRFEYIAGTNPNDPDSYFRMMSVDLDAPDSDHITIRVAGGDAGGTTQFGLAGDANGRRFIVRAADNASGTKTTAAYVADAGTGTNVWTDTNMVVETAQRYYDVVVTYAGQSFTNTEEWAAYVQPRDDAHLYLVSVPVNFGGSENTLNGELGAQLARGLSGGDGGGDQNLLDMLYRRTAGNAWKEYYLVTNLAGEAIWWDYDEADEADLAVGPGMGFLLRRRAGVGRDRNTCVFVGRSHTNAQAIYFTTNNAVDGWAWTLFGWPFAEPKQHENLGGAASPTNQLGFSALGHGGTTGLFNKPHEQKGDQIWVWEDNTFEHKFWLADGINTNVNGRWIDPETGQIADFDLKPGQAYWYRHHVATNGSVTGKSFNWTPTE
jgi:hypothetical protein